MGACSDRLDDIKAAILDGIQIRNDTDDIVNIATEDGNLSLIAASLNQFNFNEANELMVNVLFDPSQINIGQFVIEDGGENNPTAVNVGAEGGKNALYVRSNSLLKTTDFSGIVGEAIDAPAAYTLNSRVKAIVTNLDKLTYVSDRLKTNSGIVDSSDVRIDPAKEETLTELVDIMKVNNTVLDTFSISFDDSEDAGVVKPYTTITLPDPVKDIYLINIKNPSTETDIEIQLYLKEEFEGDVGVTWCKLGEAFTVEKSPDTANPIGATESNTIAQQVEGAFLAEGLGLTAKAIEGTSTTAFDLKFVIREK